MMQAHQLIELINRELASRPFTGTPAELYDPVNYIMALGGKRLRPVLVLMGAEIFGGKAEEVIPAALAIEVFHNFTLVHDDIMDQAPLRRNQPTVHTRWNTNIAILSGDNMLVKAYELLLEGNHPRQKEVLKLFSQTATQVCEGQQLDMNFETSNQVTIADYLHMITLKTAVLLGCSLQTGALLGRASAEDAAHIYEYGKHIGVGFQLMDDILDVFGEKDAVGKQVGGDIVANKKTFLLLKALEKAQGSDLAELQQWLQNHTDAAQKVKAITALYEKLGVKADAEQEMLAHFDTANLYIRKLSVDPTRYQQLTALAESLKVRIS